MREWRNPRVKPRAIDTDPIAVIGNAAQLLLPEITRPRRIGELLIVLWAFNLADLFFTLWAHRYTPFIELNPFAGAMLGQNLYASVVLYKLTLMTFASTIFWRTRTSPRTEFGLWGLVLVYGLLMIRWSNYFIEASTNVALSGWSHTFNGL